MEFPEDAHMKAPGGFSDPFGAFLYVLAQTRFFNINVLPTFFNAKPERGRRLWLFEDVL